MTARAAGDGPWIERAAGRGLDLAAGTALLGAVLGLRAGLPGTGPTTPSAATWAPFARAAVLWGAPLTALAVLLIAATLLATRASEARRPLLWLAPLLVVQTVLASALFSPWGGINLQVGGGDQQAMVDRLGGLGAAVLDRVPAVLLLGAALLLSLALPVAGRRASAWASLLLGAGFGLLLSTALLGSGALGGALFAPDGQRVAAAVVGVCLAAAGIAARRRAIGAS